jgi:hypothetical protein
MKTKILFIASIIVLSFGCSKDEDTNLQEEIPLNIILWNQPSDTIQKYIQDKWKVVYTNGGLAYHIEYYDDFYVEFTAKHEYIFSDKYTSKTTIPYQWATGNNYYPYAYMDFSGQHIDYIMGKIENDTLVFRDFADDGYNYHCVRINNH